MFDGLYNFFVKIIKDLQINSFADLLTIVSCLFFIFFFVIMFFKFFKNIIYFIVLLLLFYSFYKENPHLSKRIKQYCKEVNNFFVKELKKENKVNK